MSSVPRASNNVCNPARVHYTTSSREKKKYIDEECKHRHDAAPAVTSTVPMSQQCTFHLSSKLNVKLKSVCSKVTKGEKNKTVSPDMQRLIIKKWQYLKASILPAGKKCGPSVKPHDTVK